MEILGGASVAFALRVVAAVLVFVTNFLVVRFLGPSDAGSFFLALTCITVVSTLGLAGANISLVKFVGVNGASGNWPAVSGVHRTATLLVTLASTTGALLLFVLAPWLSGSVFADERTLAPLRILSLSIVPLSLSILNASGLRGLKRIAQSLAVQTVFVPLFFTVGLVWLVASFRLRGTAWSYVAASALTLGISGVLWRGAARRGDTRTARFPLSDLLESSIPAFWTTLGSLGMLWSGNLFLGAWAQSDQVAAFNVASRTAALVDFAAIAASAVAAPKFAELHDRGDRQGVAATLVHSCRLSALVGGTMCLALFLASTVVMRFFDASFCHAATALKFLVVGQFFIETTGSAHFLLFMSGHEKTMRNITLTCVLLQVGLLAALVPAHGVTGAAVSVAATACCYTVITTCVVYRIFGVLPLPVGRTALRKSDGGGRTSPSP
jgi:O-antigen/teichoic acid export membrane protein